MTRRDEPRAYDDALLGHRAEPAPALQWIGFFLAPAIFFVHLQLGYVLVPWACTRHGDVWLHVVNLLAVVIAGVGTWIAWLVHARAQGVADNDGPGAVPRTRFLGVVGLCMGGMFVLLLVAQAVAAIIISPCQ